MAQNVYPTSDVTNEWASGGFGDIDEGATPSDVDFTHSSDAGDETLEVHVGDPTDPVSGSGHIVRWRHVLIDGGVVASEAGAGADITVSLVENTTVRASKGPIALDAVLAWTEDSFTLSGAEADSISDYADLRIRFFAEGGGGSPAGRRGAGVSWAELETPDAAPASVDPADCDHAHAADVAGLGVNVTIADCDHGHTGDVAGLGVNVTIQEATHAHAADGATLAQNHVLAIDETLHGHAADGLTLSQVHDLIIAESAHAQTADAATLGVNVTIQDATHAQAADNAGLGVNVTIAETLHGHAADNATVTDDGAPGGDDHTLVIQETTHAHAADAALLEGVVSAADCDHGHTADNAVLEDVVAPAECVHGHIADSTQLEGVVAPADSTHSHIVDAVGIEVWLHAASALHSHTGDVVTIGQNHVLAVQEALHGHLADSVPIHFLAPGARTLTPAQLSGLTPASDRTITPGVV